MQVLVPGYPAHRGSCHLDRPDRVSLYAPFSARTGQGTQWYVTVGHVLAASVIIALIVRALDVTRA